ncbi:MAG: WD40 repeat domain-containing protein [Bauldia sp.]|nr:WD40 repeat domain-containing protein [Bauldia sp.]
MPTIQPFPFGAFVVETAFLGDTAAFALGDGTVRLVTGVAAETVRVHAGAILSAVRTQDGEKLITGGDDGRVAATDAAGKIETLAERPKKWIDQLAAGPQGAVAFGVGREALVRLADGKEKSFPEQRTIGGLAFAPKGFRLAVARYEGVTLRWINTEAPALSLEWKGAHTGVMFSPDGKYVISTMQENSLHGWRLPEGGHLRMSGYPAKPKSMSWSVKGKYLATSGSEAAILWPFLTKEGPQGKQPLQLGGRSAFVTKVACHPRQEIVAIGYADGAVGLAAFDGVDFGGLRDPGDGPVTALSWDAAGRRLAFGTEGGFGAVVEI